MTHWIPCCTFISNITTRVPTTILGLERWNKWLDAKPTLSCIGYNTHTKRCANSHDSLTPPCLMSEHRWRRGLSGQCLTCPIMVDHGSELVSVPINTMATLTLVLLQGFKVEGPELWVGTWFAVRSTSEIIQTPYPSDMLTMSGSLPFQYGI